MKPIAIVYFLFSMFYLVELRQYSAKEENQYNIERISLIQDDGTLRTEDIRMTSKFSLGNLLKPKLSAVTLYLYTRKNRKNGTSLKPNEAEKLSEIDVFDPDKPNFFIVHGWTGSRKSKICVSIKNAVLKKANMNVFVVDWSGRSKWGYALARYSVNGIGEHLAKFINDMIRIHSIKPSDFKIVGHSLGAHISGCAGKRIVNGQLDYIIGLDPARPLFKLSNSDRLNISDANFVQVIHTNANFLGFYTSLGHVDIFPNSGNQQPGCESDVTQTCSHGRSYQFFVESILSKGFTTKQCDSYVHYEEGQCDGKPSSYLGRLKIDKAASGDYYLETNAKRPYSKV